MRIILCSFCLLLMLLNVSCTIAQEQALPLNPHLAGMTRVIGKTFRGEFASSTPEKPLVDVMKWERAMNGQAVRCLHSINDGVYGGETIYIWEPAQEKIAYWYFTTAGFYTRGTLEIEGDTWTTLEDVIGSQAGITQVRATSRLLKDGSFEVKSQHLVNGRWNAGHEVIYRLAENARIEFK